jgi:N-acetyl-anhydromuramoyl-L-alanine amidase
LKSISPEGWLSGSRRVESPNCDERPAGVLPEIVVVHAISLPPMEFGGSAVEALFTNTLEADAHPYFAQIAGLRVSAHFFIRREGEIVQCVSTEQRAWHAGVSTWRGRERCNDFSVGIELEGCDDLPFTPAQYDALNEALMALRARYPNLREAVGHSDIAPGRKTDPGPYFKWEAVDAGWRDGQPA